MLAGLTVAAVVASCGGSRGGSGGAGARDHGTIERRLVSSGAQGSGGVAAFLLIWTRPLARASVLLVEGLQVDPLSGDVVLAGRLRGKAQKRERLLPVRRSLR